MTARRITRISIICIALITHGIAIYTSWAYEGTLALPANWFSQVRILILVSLGITGLALTTGRRWLLHLFILLKFFIIVVIGIPFGELLNIEILLFLPFVVEIIYLVGDWSSLAVTLVFTSFLAFRQTPDSAWGVSIHSARIVDIVILVGLCLLTASTAYLLMHFLRLAEHKELDAQRLDRAMDELTKINLDYQNYTIKLEKETIDKERKRLSREIHDIIGYTMINQLMILQAALSMQDRNTHKLEELLMRARDQLNDGVKEARGTLEQFRNQEISYETGIQLLQKMVKTFAYISSVQINIDFANIRERTFGPDRDKALFRFVQEGIINALRHGRATHIDITFMQSSDYLLVNIWDNGTGSQKIVEGIGISGMRERMERFGGEVSYHSGKQNFALHAKIPIGQTTTSSKQPSEQHEVKLAAGKQE
jgi:signal transduction histidine kinase